MLLAEVVSRIWFARQLPEVEGRRMVVVRDTSTDALCVAVDLIGVSVGNRVVVTTDEAARVAVASSAVDAAVIALVSGTDSGVAAAS